MDSVPGVYKKIAQVMGSVERIPKNGRNDFHKYDYVTEADLVDHIRPLMAELGLVVIPSQTSIREDEADEKNNNVARIHHEFTFVDADDGSSVTLGVWGEGQDKGDKGSYKAFTGAMKYALMKTFCVATGDDPEDSGRNPVESKGKKSSEQKNKKKKPSPKAASKNQKERINQMMTSSKVTPSERDGIVKKMKSDGTVDVASKIIDWLSSTIKERERVLKMDPDELEGVTIEVNKQEFTGEEWVEYYREATAESEAA